MEASGSDYGFAVYRVHISFLLKTPHMRNIPIAKRTELVVSGTVDTVQAPGVEVEPIGYPDASRHVVSPKHVIAKSEPR